MPSIDKPSSVCHSSSQETPRPIYTALLVHSRTCKRKLVDKLYHLGLSMSYDRLMKITTDIANSVCAKYVTEDLVCSAGLIRGQSQ